MKNENEQKKLVRPVILETIHKEAKRQIRFWNILFYVNSLFMGINVFGSFMEKRPWTFNLIISLAMMIYCYYHIHRVTKILDVVEEAMHGQGNTGKREEKPSEPNQPA